MLHVLHVSLWSDTIHQIPFFHYILYDTTSMLIKQNLFSRSKGGHSTTLVADPWCHDLFESLEVLGKESSSRSSIKFSHSSKIIIPKLLLKIYLCFIFWGLVVIPFYLGREMFTSIPQIPITHGIKFNDLYAFNMGCYFIWPIAEGVDQFPQSPHCRAS